MLVKTLAKGVLLFLFILRAFADPLELNLLRPPHPDSTLSHFAPKRSLDEVRFVFESSGSYYCQLSIRQPMLYHEFTSQFNFNPDDHKVMGSRFSQSEEDWLMDRIPEQSGAYFTILSADSLANGKARFLGVTPLSSGDGFAGLLGRLDLSATSSRNKGNSLRVVGLAFAGEKEKEKLISRTMPRPPSREINAESVIEEIEEATGMSDLELIEGLDIFYLYPKFSGIVVMVSSPPKQSNYLFCLAQHGRNWHIVPIAREDFIDDSLAGGLLLEETPGEHHFYYRNPALYVFPDIDGDGASEVLLVSDSQSVLFETCLIRASRPGYFTPAVVERKSVYFGF